MADSDLQSLSISLFNTSLGNEKSPSVMDLIKKACSDKNFPVLKYILNTTRYVPTEPIDEFGNTILHFIVYNIEEMGGIPFLETYLSNPNIKKIIDIISKKDGFTPAIAACTMKRFDIVNMLDKAGANIKLPSRDGTMIVTATETEVKKDSEIPKSDTQKKSMKDAAFGFLSRLTSIAASDKLSDGVTDGSLDMTSVAKRSVAPTQQSSMKHSPKPVDQVELTTDAFVAGVMNGTLAKSPLVTPTVGGSRAVVVGQRFLNNAPEFSSISGGASETRKKKKSSKRSSKRSLSRTSERSMTSEKRGSVELGRITDDIHSRTIETIRSLMGVDEETAKVYKSVLYFRIKKDHPEMTGYERAIEMEKLATKDVLKKIDIDDEKKRYAEFKAAKSDSATSSEKKVSEKKPKRKQATSDSESESSEKKSKRKTKKSTEEVTSSPELDTNLSM